MYTTGTGGLYTIGLVSRSLNCKVWLYTILSFLQCFSVVKVDVCAGVHVCVCMFVVMCMCACYV